MLSFFSCSLLLIREPFTYRLYSIPLLIEWSDLKWLSIHLIHYIHAVEYIYAEQLTSETYNDKRSYGVWDYGCICVNGNVWKARKCDTGERDGLERVRNGDGKNSIGQRKWKCRKVKCLWIGNLSCCSTLWKSKCNHAAIFLVNETWMKGKH